MKEIISLRQLHESGKIDWIQSPLTLRRWVEKDIRINNILKAVVIKSNSKTGTRYFIPSKNIDKFIELFKDNTLYEKRD